MVPWLAKALPISRPPAAARPAAVERLGGPPLEQQPDRERHLDRVERVGARLGGLAPEVGRDGEQGRRRPGQPPANAQSPGDQVGQADGGRALVFTFFFRDPNSGDEGERVNIGFGDLVFDGSSFTGTLVTQFGGNALLVGDIQANGFVMYRVRALSGEFILDGSLAQFTTVPEGGSAAALLGIALIGIEVMRRKLRTA